jgi:hypothetical protein
VAGGWLAGGGARRLYQRKLGLSPCRRVTFTITRHRLHTIVLFEFRSKFEASAVVGTAIDESLM